MLKNSAGLKGGPLTTFSLHSPAGTLLPKKSRQPQSPVWTLDVGGLLLFLYLLLTLLFCSNETTLLYFSIDVVQVVLILSPAPRWAYKPADSLEHHSLLAIMHVWSNTYGICGPKRVSKTQFWDFWGTLRRKDLSLLRFLKTQNISQNYWQPVFFFEMKLNESYLPRTALTIFVYIISFNSHINPMGCQFYFLRWQSLEVSGIDSEPRLPMFKFWLSHLLVV